jgi:hypothetical protein
MMRRIGATHLMIDHEEAEIHGFMGMSVGFPKVFVAW